jgi:hypothetical protein
MKRKSKMKKITRTHAVTGEKLIRVSCPVCKGDETCLDISLGLNPPKLPEHHYYLKRFYIENQSWLSKLFGAKEITEIYGCACGKEMYIIKRNRK